MATNRFIKDPEAVLDYEIDWSLWLSGDTITESSWTVESGLTKGSDFYTDTTTTVWLSGGTVMTTYLAVNHIVTAAGREDDRTIKIVCRDK